MESTLSLDDRFVLCNLAVEMDAKAAIFGSDQATIDYLADRTTRDGLPVYADPGARYVRELVLDLSTLSPMVALPHSPDNVVPLAQVSGTPIQMVFIGTCTGGRVADYHAALRVLELSGGRVAPGVQLVITPAISSEIDSRLREDGTLARFAAMGATITTPGCGACCGTSGVIPGDGMNVLSTANRNFKARMGNARAAIYLASPAACAAAACNRRGHRSRAGDLTCPSVSKAAPAALATTSTPTTSSRRRGRRKRSMVPCCGSTLAIRN